MQNDPAFEREIRVVLVDDHEIVRAGFRTLLEHIPGIVVVGEGGDGREAVTLAGELQPDLMLMDVLMPQMGGVEATRLIKARHPNIRIIILSGWGGEHADAALKAGALGYVMKGSRVAVLKAAIAAVMRGEVYSIASVEARPDGRAEEPKGVDLLTGRQRDVFQLLVEGRATKEIAYILDISPKTVETHRVEVLRRLGVRDVPALIRYAMSIGALPPQLDDSARAS